MTINNQEFTREMSVIVTPQAQKILAHTPYSIEEFVDWSINQNKFSLGGHNATVFLEKKFDE